MNYTIHNLTCSDRYFRLLWCKLVLIVLPGSSNAPLWSTTSHTWPIFHPQTYFPCYLTCNDRPPGWYDQHPPTVTKPPHFEQVRPSDRDGPSTQNKDNQSPKDHASVIQVIAEQWNNWKLWQYEWPAMTTSMFF